MERRQRLNKVEVVSGIFTLGLFTLFGMAACDAGSRFKENSMNTVGISNCRQVIIALKIYASDHDGKYPDAHVSGMKTANTVFRKLFDERILDDETIFGCPLSPFEPDGVIQDPYLGPESTQFAKAVQPDENHWALTAGLTDSSARNIPLIYENAVNATWPPKWNADKAGKPARGRAWTHGIIIGLNDGSVALRPLAGKNGAAIGLKPEASTGKDLFDGAIDSTHFPKGEVLDVE